MELLGLNPFDMEHKVLQPNSSMYSLALVLSRKEFIEYFHIFLGRCVCPGERKPEKKVAGVLTSKPPSPNCHSNFDWLIAVAEGQIILDFSRFEIIGKRVAIGYCPTPHVNVIFQAACMSRLIPPSSPFSHSLCPIKGMQVTVYFCL